MGKTALLERLFAGIAEVISADALQIYRGMDIGTAKPSPETLALIPHHLIDIREVDESFSVGEFCHIADYHMMDICARGLLPVISGGTAYYIKTWLLGGPGTPPSDPLIRRKIEKQWTGRDDAELHKALQNVDPEGAGKIAIGDRYRAIRALEVFEQCGKPLSSFAVPNRPRTDVEVLSIGLRRSREDLAMRIERRVDLMIESGLQKEVERLRECYAGPSNPGMKGIGYKEWLGTPENPLPTVREVRELIIRNTKRYAKRQLTFFASLPNIHWIDIHDEEQAFDEIMEIASGFGNMRKFP